MVRVIFRSCMLPRMKLVWVPLSLVLLSAQLAFGQSNLQVPVQFDFLDPGARSLALGSAFAPLADDATAGVNNPSGLVQLSDPEVSFEVRGRRVATSFLQGGRLSGPVSNRGIDTFSGPIYAETVDANVFPAYVSFVYPKGRWSLAAYSHQFVKTDQEFERTGVLGLFTTPFGVVQDAREPPQRVTRTVEVVTHGLSAGYRLSTWFSFGAGVSVNDFSFHEASTRFATEGIDLISLDPVHPSVYGAPDFSRGASGGFSSRREVLSPRIEGNDITLGFNMGFLAKIHRMVTIGGVFRSGPSFNFELILPDNTRTEGSFDVPDTMTIGVALRPTDTFTLVADYTRVQYSSLRSGFVDVIVGPDSRPDLFSIQDGNEGHIGVEYVLANVRMSPAIRIGGWYDPAHGVRFERSSQLNPFFNDLFSSALEGGEDLLHYTAGVGFSLNRHLEINLAGDFTTRNRLWSSSAIFRF